LFRVKAPHNHPAYSLSTPGSYKYKSLHGAVNELFVSFISSPFGGVDVAVEAKELHNRLHSARIQPYHKEPY
ncbi:MAG: hypothetical protein PHN84_15005, partial [Desulfuromonadaceae bacterium]|nr:hypothetical protein [Desulfuromonadaceae bacterium]MDD2856951.1 hypothetical protein [Desulfuromonadaceae bacterium]